MGSNPAGRLIVRNVKLLEEFVKLEIDEGKKLNAALGLSIASLAATDGMTNDDWFRVRNEPIPKVAKYDIEPEDVQSKQPEPKRRQNRPRPREFPQFSKKDYQAMIKQAADDVGISAAFVDAIARTESNYNPRAISHAGAEGIMQFMPSTARAVGLDDSFDPTKAIPAGARHLKDLLDMFDGDYTLAAAAYNAGPGNVRKHGGVPPFDETQRYVVKIAERMKTSIFAEPDAEDDMDEHDFDEMFRDVDDLIER